MASSAAYPTYPLRPFPQTPYPTYPLASDNYSSYSSYPSKPIPPSTYPSYPPKPSTFSSYSEFRPIENPESQKNTSLLGCLAVRIGSTVAFAAYLPICAISLILGIYVIIGTQYLYLAILLMLGVPLILTGLVPAMIGVLKNSYKLVRFAPITSFLVILWNIGMVITCFALKATGRPQLRNGFFEDWPFESIFLIIAAVFHMLAMIVGIACTIVFWTLYKDMKSEAIKSNRMHEAAPVY